MRAAGADVRPMPGSFPSSHQTQLPLPEGEAFHRTSSLQQLPPDRSRPLTRGGSSEHDHISRSKARSNIITPEEYEALPLSIQKKYFSSVERLRIAQQSAAEKRKKQQPNASEAWLSPQPSIESLRPKTAHSFRPSIVRHSRRAPYSRPKRTDADVDEEQALRFLALPEKVKRSHFTPEELMLLTESSERALGAPSWVSEDDFHQRMALDRNGSVSSSQFRSSESEDCREDLEKEWHMEAEEESIASFDHIGEKEMISRRPEAQRRQDSMSSSNSALPPPGDRPRHLSQRPFSRKRAISLAPLPLPPPTLRPAGSLPSTASHGQLANATIPSATSDENVISTRYYKDSEARQKLREYLASPEKFDEALEFGFPSESLAVERSVSVHSNSTPALQSDRSDVVSASNDRGEEEETFSSQSPRTPSAGTDLFHPSNTYHSSLDSGVALPYSSIKPGPRSVSPDISGREMTLRMTLTRPDLRAPEQELYAFQRKQVSGVDVETTDPLALETLSVCDDHTGAHGAFAVSKQSSGGFMKAFKNFRIR